MSATKIRYVITLLSICVHHVCASHQASSGRGAQSHPAHATRVGGSNVEDVRTQTRLAAVICVLGAERKERGTGPDGFAFPQQRRPRHWRPTGRESWNARPVSPARFQTNAEP